MAEDGDLIEIELPSEGDTSFVPRLKADYDKDEEGLETIIFEYPEGMMITGYRRS